MDTLSLPADRVIQGDLPLYANVTLVTAERHRDLFLAGDTTFAFAAHAAVVPLTIDEFERAALDYPIVFFGPTRRAFAVMGLSADRNLFIDAAGTFRPGAYVPAYLRRHPFVLVRAPDQQAWVLGIDEASERLAGSDDLGERRLFDDAVPTDTLRDVVVFCESYQNAQERTDRLVEMLDDLDLFEPRQAHRRDGDADHPTLLLDYVTISRERLEALDPADVARLRGICGWGPSYAQLFSAANWDRLALPR